nr:hypothetical protein Q903MT_gene5205 [Picea sitchensis]
MLRYPVLFLEVELRLLERSVVHSDLFLEVTFQQVIVFQSVEFRYSVMFLSH